VFGFIRCSRSRVCLAIAAFVIAACQPRSVVAPAPDRSVAVHIGPPTDASVSVDAEAAAPMRTINYLGRFVFDDNGSAAFSWPGSAIEARFRGDAISARIEDSGWDFLDVRIDDKLHSRLNLKKGLHSYVIAENLGDAPHTVRLARRNEGHGGVTRFYGFDRDLLAAPPLPVRRIEFIGDSISCGFGVDGQGPCSFEYATENHENAFPALVGRALDAEVHTIAWSGFGMLRGADGSPGANIPAIFARTLATEREPRWDFETWQPHAVVINLSTNDFGQGDPGVAFASATERFLNTLRGLYPKALLVLATSPMLASTKVAISKQYFDTAQRARLRAGDANVRVVEVPRQTEQQSFGCGRHPGKENNQAVAQVIAAALSTAWQ
jgi:lysophospholipase L1-like esterase